jgi:hypothetical protein
MRKYPPTWTADDSLTITGFGAQIRSLCAPVARICMSERRSLP